MAYEAHKWKIGEEITSEKLNHIEKGIEAGGGSGPLVVTETEDNGVFTMDHTWQEIHDAFPNVEFVNAGGFRNFIIYTNTEDNDYSITVMSMGNSEQGTYSTDSPTGYPTTSSVDIVVG